MYTVHQLPLHNPRVCLCVFSWTTFRAGSELSYHHIPPQMRSEISPLGMKRANARGRIGGNWSISATPPNLSQRLHSPTDQIISSLRTKPLSNPCILIDCFKGTIGILTQVMLSCPLGYFVFFLIFSLQIFSGNT